jgi:hypothetical protein
MRRLTEQERQAIREAAQAEARRDDERARWFRRMWLFRPPCW